MPEPREKSLLLAANKVPSYKPGKKKIVMNTNRTSSGVPMHCEVLADRKLNRTHVLIHQSAEKPNPAETEHNEKKGDQLNLQ